MSARDGKIKIRNRSDDTLIYLNDRLHSGKLVSKPTKIGPNKTGTIKVGSKSSKGARGNVRFYSEERGYLYRAYFNHPFGSKRTTYKMSYLAPGISASGKQHPTGHDSETTLTLTGSIGDTKPKLKQVKDRVRYDKPWNDKKKGKIYQAYKWKESDSNFRIYKPSVRETSSSFTIIFKMDHIRGSAKDDHAGIEIKINKRNGTVSALDIQFTYSGHDAFNLKIPMTESHPKAAAAQVAVDITDEVLDRLSGIDHGGRLIFPSICLAEAEMILHYIGIMFPDDGSSSQSTLADLIRARNSAIRKKPSLIKKAKAKKVKSKKK